jgi:hypothetical protein
MVIHSSLVLRNVFLHPKAKKSRIYTVPYPEGKKGKILYNTHNYHLFSQKKTQTVHLCSLLVIQNEPYNTADVCREGE